jgi:hypothetical protein
MQQNIEVPCSIKCIREITAMNLLIAMGGNSKIFRNDEKLIVTSELDPSTYQSIKRVNMRKRVESTRGETDISEERLSGSWRQTQ